MLLKKLFTKIFAVGTIAGALPCSALSNNNNNNIVNDNPTVLINRSNELKLGNKFSLDEEDKFIPAVLDSVSSLGCQMICAATYVGAKYLVTSILKNYGVDIGEVSLQYLERIEGEIKEIQNQLNVISSNMDQYNAEDNLKNLYSYVNYASVDIMNEVKGGLFKLASMESDKNNSDEYLEQQKKNYYNTSLKDFKIEGTNIANFTTRFANTILTPVKSCPTNDLFHYYQLTNGKFDKWSTQSYKNRRNYIAYLDTLLLSCANLAIFDYQYRSEGMDEASKASNDQRISNMITAVNDVNGMFQKELQRLDGYKELQNKGELIYLPTGKHFSSKMATLTFNHDDVERQLLLKGVEQESNNLFTGRKKNLLSYMLTYQTTHKMVNDVVEDYKNYIKAYGLKDYTINQYLKDIGFSADRQDLFDKANGLYYGEVNIAYSGYLGDDLSIKAKFYDRNGDFQNKTQFFVSCKHKFMIADEYVVDYSDQDYYLCFQNTDFTLDGEYWTNSFRGSKGNGTLDNLIGAFANFLKNRVSNEDPIVKNAKAQ